MTSPLRTVVTHPAAGFLSISAVERDTGLSKDVLRVWERRYGFPMPVRDDNDERHYPLPQVERLRAIKRLLDAGHRPGKLLGLSDEALDTLSTQLARTWRAGDAAAETLQNQVFAVLLDGQMSRLRELLSRCLLKQGLQAFVIETLAPLNRAVADANTRGMLETFHEGAYVEQATQVLRGAIAHTALPHAPPRIVLATLPNETSALGLLMVEALLLPEGATCISIGTQVPIAQIAAAVSAFEADIVVLPFSPSFSVKHALESLEALRSLLPASVALWAGGELIRRVRRDLSGVTITGALPDKLAALRQWRATHSARPEGHLR